MPILHRISTKHGSLSVNQYSDTCIYREDNEASRYESFNLSSPQRRVRPFYYIFLQIHFLCIYLWEIYLIFHRAISISANFRMCIHSEANRPFTITSWFIAAYIQVGITNSTNSFLQHFINNALIRNRKQVIIQMYKSN